MPNLFFLGIHFVHSKRGCLTVPAVAVRAHNVLNSSLRHFVASNVSIPAQLKNGVLVTRFYFI